MVKNLKEKWLEAMNKKDSNLVAGLDPAEHEMGRGEKGLREGVDKHEWSKDYVRAIAPFAAGLKYNIQYWKGSGDFEALVEITDIAHDAGMIVIDDSKLADIGSTNDAGFYWAAKRGADAVTYSPFAGNIEEAKQQGEKHGIGVIGMCLMSNPQYKAEKNKLVPITRVDLFDSNDVEFDVVVDGERIPHVKQYKKLAFDYNEHKVDGMVIGAPSPKNHITEEEVKTAHFYNGESLVLYPGIGAQEGGYLAFKYFGDLVMANVGRAGMFPEGSASTPEQQNARAMKYRDEFNEAKRV